ncbi:hypothetical protein TI39_contig576g00003 [Zymoseptoria brevis]|uniref:Uncharacterized protein n=1 Tax=Zymoseptoria brevis TaxID=1047168 RepID=A0A0F4GIG5_9PEZI|nr:hypothetical protein TI39_contig576g00003 [Zymoseptoria brevis]
MADENNTNNDIPPTPSPPRSARRSSFAGETFANLFSSQRGSISRSPSDAHPPTAQQPTPSYPGPITTAAAQAQRRRLSLTTLGLSGSPNSTSPFGSYHSRRDSYVSSGTSEAIDESAIEEDSGGGGSGIPAQNPFGRRMSFGAKALRDVRTTSGTSPGQNNGTSGEGFNWSDNFRNRAERTASIAGGMTGGPPAPPAHLHQSRAKSVATMEPPATVMPKPKEQVRPDHFQERILKGDFYMD